MFIKKTLVAGFTAMLISLSATAETTAEALNYNLVKFSEGASATVPRDIMTVNLNIKEEGKDHSQVNRNFVQKYNALNQRIKANPNFKSELINRTSSPQYQDYKGKAIQSGWEENAQIMVESQDFSALNRLITEAQKEASLSSISFRVSKQKREAVIDEVSKAAIQRFKDRAATLARNLGFNSYKIVQLDLGQIGNKQQRVLSRMSGFAAFHNDVNDNPDVGTEEISVKVSATIQM